MRTKMRGIAAVLTSVLAVGAFALPAGAAEPSESLEGTVCNAVEEQLGELLATIASFTTARTAAQAEVEETRDALDAAAADLAAAGRAFILAVDAEEDYADELEDFYAEAAVFITQMTDWLDAQNALNVLETSIGLNEIARDYLGAYCPD